MGLALLALTLGCAPAAAAPLCRDLKGLFTPCPDALTKSAQQRLERRIAAAQVETAPPVVVHPVRFAAMRAANPPHARLCRDSKGLFTPCPR